MKQLILLSLLSFQFVLFAQDVIPSFYDTTKYAKYELVFNANIDYGATSIKNDFLNKFIFGGNITDEIKDNSFVKHKGINRVGLIGTSEFQFVNYKSNLFKNEKYGWLIKSGVYLESGMVYSKNLFGLAFYGNEQYLGQNADFSGTRINSWMYQKIGFGIVDKKSKSSLALNFVGVNHQLSSTINEGNLYQSDDAYSLSLIYDGYAMNKLNGIKNYGWGLSLDLDIKIPVMAIKGKTSYVQLMVGNLGFAYMPNFKKYEADSNFTFTGLTFNQLFGDAQIFDSTFSVLDTLNIRSTNVSQVKMLPMMVQVGKIVDQMNTSKLQSFFGARLFPTLYAIPQVYAGLHYQPIKSVGLGLSAQYGGFTKFRAGLYAAFQVKNWNFGLATDNLLGMVSKQAYGKSLMFRLNCRI